MARRRVFATTKYFFDRQEVIDALDVAERKALSKFGAFVRRRAQSSMRPKKKPSKPGKPPRVVQGNLKKFLFFAFDPKSKSVVIGPEPIGNRPIVPRLLELGGRARVGARSKKPYGPLILPRPYMQPAFLKELDKAEKQFQNKLKKGR